MFAEESVLFSNSQILLFLAQFVSIQCNSYEGLGEGPVPLQGIFPTQNGMNLRLLHCRQILYC